MYGCYAEKLQGRAVPRETFWYILGPMVPGKPKVAYSVVRFDRKDKYRR